MFKHLALPAPDACVKSQMYVQRYMAHFPSGGEVVIFDRSWYNRAGVEPVMGYCTQEGTKRFLAMVPLVEKAMVDDGIILIKYFLLLSQIPYEPPGPMDVKMPKPPSHRGYVEPESSRPNIPTPF